MNIAASVADSELPTLKRLAGELAAADAPPLSVLDQIASLAAEIAARFREGARQEALARVTAGTQAIYPSGGPNGGDDLASRVQQSSLDELSALAGLLDDAAAARAALAQADADLMAARDRGDYAAMAPLALAADSQKSAFATATGEFASRVGLAGALTAELVVPTTAGEPAGEAARPDEPGASTWPAAAPFNSPPAEASEVLSAAAEPIDTVLDLGLRPTSQGERRRIRDLIRQVRSTPDEA